MMQASTYARRNELLDHFRGSRFLPEDERKSIARRHGVRLDRLTEDLRILREEGCLEMKGVRQYKWLAPYRPVSKSKSPNKRKPTKRMKCMRGGCNTIIDSTGPHHRMCDKHRKDTGGLI